MSGIDARVRKALPAVRDSPSFGLDLHLQCSHGIVVVFGPSGSGKTLLLNCLGGFARPDQGRILVDGQLYFDGATGVDVPPDRRRCAYIFQDHALFPHMTVRQNLRFAASLPARGAGRLHIHRRISELLDAFDLNELANRKPAQLSGGQKQRAALARILITEPRLVLLDEPSRGLDTRLRQSFWDLLRSVRERLSVPILLVSHDMDECCQLADSILILEAGKLLQFGPRDAVLGQPATIEVARLLGLYNITPAQIQALDPAADLSRLRVAGGEIETHYLPGHFIGDQGYVCLRRSETKITAACRQNRNELTLLIESRQASPLGVRLALAGGFAVTVSEDEAGRLSDGDPLTLAVPPAAVTFLTK